MPLPIFQDYFSHWHLRFPLVLVKWLWLIEAEWHKLTIIGSDNGLSPGWRQAIIWTNLNLRNKRQWNLKQNSYNFHQRKCIWKCRLRIGGNFVAVLIKYMDRIDPYQTTAKQNNGQTVCIFVGMNKDFCVLCTVATDALVLMHEAISIHSAD